MQLLQGSLLLSNSHTAKTVKAMKSLGEKFKQQKTTTDHMDIIQDEINRSVKMPMERMHRDLNRIRGDSSDLKRETTSQDGIS